MKRVKCSSCKKTRPVDRPDQLKTTLCRACTAKSPHPRQWSTSGKPETQENISRAETLPCTLCGEPATGKLEASGRSICPACMPVYDCMRVQINRRDGVRNEYMEG